MIKTICLWFFLLVLGACSTKKPGEVIKIVGEAQGTYYSIVYYDDLARDLQTQVDSILKAFDQSVSLWVPESILCRINNGDSTVVPDRFFKDNFAISEQVAAETDGAFDITIGPLAKAWGFGSDGVKNADPQIIDSLLPLVGYKKVKLVDGKVVREDPRIKFDFNAVAQGYSVDVVGDFLESMDIHNYLVDIGGEVKGNGHKPDGSWWKVGIEKPARDKTNDRVLSAIIELENASIATSGNYRAYFEDNGIRYSHTIDPKTGYPARQTLLSATILCDSTAFADAYATACMVMGLEKSLEFVNANPKLEAFFIYSTPDGFASVATDGFKKRITKEFDE
jgi:thiamine biosynthesis lipoprotein